MDLDAFILIGGRSSRMGVDKAFLEIGGESLAARCANIVEKALSPNRLTFVARNENQFKADQILTLGRAVIADLKPGFGAWSGIESALENAESNWIFILACDLPFISDEFLRLLAGFADSGNDAVVPRQPDKRLQPLCAFYRTEPTLTKVKTLFTGHESLPALHSIFDDMKTRIVEPEEYGDLPNAEKLFLNINTANDLAAALS